MIVKTLPVLSLTISLLACALQERTPRGGATTADTLTGRSGAVPAGAPAAAAGDWRVRPDGIGPIRVGVSLAALGRALDEQLSADYTDFERCDYIRTAGMPSAVSLMILDDTVARVDVTEAGVRTVEGVEVGDSEARVLDVYRGRVVVEPHKYDWPEGHYLVVSPPGDSLHRVIFETDGKRVTMFRAGRRPAVEFVEGCA